MTLDRSYQGTSIEEIVELLGKYGKEAKLIAGGTDIVIAMRNGRVSPKLLIDISKIEELKKIEDDGEYITLGGGVSFTQIVEEPLFHENLYGLYKSCRMVGSPQIRNKGTIGGNIANGSPAADSAPPLIALDSIVKLVSQEGVREIALDDYYQDQIKDNELLTEIKFKKPKEREILSFSKLGLRKALAISRLTLSGLIEFDEDDRISSIRVASGALAKYPMREKEVEEYLLNKKINEETIEGAIEVLRSSMDVRLEGRSTLPYKRIAINTILREVLESAASFKSEVVM